MILDPSGAKVWWDYQVGTYMGQLGELKVGNSAGEILTVADLETALSVDLSADTGAQLQAAFSQTPFTGADRWIAKSRIFGLFSQASLRAMRTAAKTDIDVEIFLWMFDNAPDPTNLADPDFIKGVNAMAAIGYFTADDAQRILKGIPWAA